MDVSAHCWGPVHGSRYLSTQYEVLGPAVENRPTIWTIGHSTRSFPELLAALAPYEIELVADVRRYPGSRRLPQFAEAALREELESHGLSYQWIPALGGRRRAAPDTPNIGWRHPAFRGYADHVQSEEFA